MEGEGEEMGGGPEEKEEEALDSVQKIGSRRVALEMPCNLCY